MRKLKVTGEYQDMRLDRFVSKTCDIPKSALWRMIRTGKVKLNEKRAKPEQRLCSGDEITVYSQQAESREITYIKTPSPEIVYEDEFILAANKPPALKTQPSSSKPEDCLTERVKYYLKDELQKYDGAFAPGAVNRLDTNTSGIVLFGKTPSAAAELNYLSRSGKITKLYYTLVQGEFPDKRKITHWAAKDSKLNKMSLYDEKREGLCEMTSVFEPIACARGTTLLLVRLITGRSHQIRAQLAHMGFPVAGDLKYGEAEFNIRMREECRLKRQFLHCAYTSFNQWYGAGSIKIISKPYEDLEGCLKALGIKIPHL